MAFCKDAEERGAANAALNLHKRPLRHKSIFFRQCFFANYLAPRCLLAPTVYF